MSLKVLEIERHVAIVVPEDVVVVNAEHAGLCGVRFEFFLGRATPTAVFDNVVAAFYARIEVGPQSGECVVAVAFEIEEFVPVLVVRDAVTTHPEVVAQDLSAL